MSRDTAKRPVDYPYVETRVPTGSMFTNKLFTGQREVTGLGIYHYGARFYSPKLGRFISADTIVPGSANPQNLNRYSYVTNNPLRYTDPTGHIRSECGEDGDECGGSGSSNGSGGSGNGGGGDGGGDDDDDDDDDLSSLADIYDPAPDTNLPPPICAGPRWGNGECVDIVQLSDDAFTSMEEVLNGYDFSAFGFGIGGEVGSNPGAFAGGIEGIHFTDNNGNDLFYYGGPTFTGGVEATAGPYALFGFNMYDYNDYRGISQNVNLTVAYGEGVTIGYFWSGINPLQPGAPQGLVIGYTPGIALSMSYSEPEYHPLLVGRGY